MYYKPSIHNDHFVVVQIQSSNGEFLRELETLFKKEGEGRYRLRIWDEKGDLKPILRLIDLAEPVRILNSYIFSRNSR